MLIAIVWALRRARRPDVLRPRPPARARVPGAHGPRVKITEERLEQVEAFFERRGGDDDPDRALHRPGARDRAVHRRRVAACRCAASCPTTCSAPASGRRRSACSATSSGARSTSSRRGSRAGCSRSASSSRVVVGIVFLVRLQRSPEPRARTRRGSPRSSRSRCCARSRRTCARPGTASCGPRGAGSGGPRASSGTASRRASWGSSSRRCSRSPPSARSRSSLLGDAPEARMQQRLDDLAFDIADRALLRAGQGRRSWGSRRSGRCPVVALVVAATALWAAARRRYLDALALVVGAPADAGWRSTSPRRRTTARARRRATSTTDGLSYPVGPRGLRGRLGRVRRRARARRRRLRDRASPPSRSRRAGGGDRR